MVINLENFQKGCEIVVLTGKWRKHLKEDLLNGNKESLNTTFINSTSSFHAQRVQLPIGILLPRSILVLQLIPSIFD